MRRITYCLCTILRKKQEAPSSFGEHAIEESKSHEAPIFVFAPRPDVWREEWILFPRVYREGKKRRKNPNSTLSPHHISFLFCFLLHLTLGRTTRKNPSRELRERFYAIER